MWVIPLAIVRQNNSHLNNFLLNELLGQISSVSKMDPNEKGNPSQLPTGVPFSSKSYHNTEYSRFKRVTKKSSHRICPSPNSDKQILIIMQLHSYHSHLLPGSHY